MPKSSPEKLAKALRANLKRRKGPKALEGLEDGRAAKRAPEQRSIDTPPAPPPGPAPKPPKNVS